MVDAATSPPVHESPRSRPRAVGELLVVSLAVTTVAAIVALPVAAALDARWSLVFVYLRWLAICVLLAAPVLQQVATRRASALRLPWVMRTPATALLLMTESILFDIASARLGD